MSHIRQVQPAQPFPTPIWPPCAALNAHGAAARALGTLARVTMPRCLLHDLVQLMASSGDERSGELRGLAEAAGPVLGQVEDARHVGRNPEGQLGRRCVAIARELGCFERVSHPYGPP